MSVPASAPSPPWLPLLAGLMAGGLFLLPRLAAGAPALALPLGVAGLFAALPLLVVRISGRFTQAAQAFAVAFLFISLVESTEGAVGFALLFGLWALLGGEVMVRRKSVIVGCAAGFAALAVEALATVFSEGTAPIEATLRSPQVQTAFDQWAAQAPMGPAEAKTAIEQVRSGIVALYPSLTVISAGAMVAFNAIALGRFVSFRQSPSYPVGELRMLRWPLALVAGFVLSGAMLLAPGLDLVAWNGLVITMFLFLLQGLSVLSFGLARLFSSELMRTFFLVASLLGPWAIFLCLLGLFDQWIDFRSRFQSSDAPAAPTNQNLQ
ncbi:MAG: DUF2232 domain-containing protein [Vicinamibacteria bacterium]|nr:DUF2232 domain-containing protein [Vicinamibacteria bacterium]